MVAEVNWERCHHRDRFKLRSPELSNGCCGEGERAGTDDDGPDSTWSIGDPSFSGIMTM
jgi:hypothetical protein